MLGRVSDLAGDFRHHRVQKGETCPIRGKSLFVRIGDATMIAIGNEHDGGALVQQPFADLVRLIFAHADNVGVLGEIQTADPAALVAGQINPAFLHAQDRVFVRGMSSRLFTDACALHLEPMPELLLEKHLHHGAAAGIPQTHAKNFLHYVPLFVNVSVRKINNRIYIDYSQAC